MYLPKPLDFMAIEVAAVPVDTTGAAVTGDYYSLENYTNLCFVIYQGAWAGGTPAVTIDQAKTVAGGSAKDIQSGSLTEYWSKTGITGGVYTRTAVSSDTFNLTTTANTITVINCDHRMLDVANGFDCLQLDIASPGTNADLICVAAFLYNSRFAEGLGGPDPKVD